MKKIKVNKPIDQLKPVDVKCSDTKCEQGFHYYTSKIIRRNGSIGDCKSCGDSSIDWDRIHQHDLNDLDYTFTSLKKELLRHVCWVNKIDPEAIERAHKRGKKAILLRAETIVTKKIAKIPTSHFDNMCTPKTGVEIIHYAQHATGTCCRKCLDRWHNIPSNIVLDSSQIHYCVKLIERFIDERIPNLVEEPEIATYALH